LAFAIHLVVFEITLIALELSLIPSINALLLLPCFKTTHKSISVWKFLHAFQAMRQIIKPGSFIRVELIDKFSISILFVFSYSPNIVLVWRENKQTFRTVYDSLSQVSFEILSLLRKYFGISMRHSFKPFTNIVYSKS
jgi:hypothetical protein